MATRTGAKAVGQGEAEVNVRDLGALGDGLASDTQAFADAGVRLATSQAKVLRIPAGRYRHTAAWSIPSGTTVYAEEGAVVVLDAPLVRFIDLNNKSRIRFTGNLTIDLKGNVSSAGVRASTGAQNHTFRGLRLTSSTPMQEGTYGFDLNSGAYAINLIGCELESLPQPVRVFGRVVRSGVRRCTLRGWGNRGVYVVGSTTEASQDFWVEDNTIDEVGWYRNVTRKTAAGGTATLELEGTTNPYVPGMVTVAQGLGAPFDGQLTVLTATQPNGATPATITYAAAGTVAATAVAFNPLDPAAVVQAGDPRQPIAVQLGVGGPKHRGLRVNRNSVTGNGTAHHLTTTGDPESGRLLGGTADQISIHGAYGFQCLGNTSTDGGEVGITISNTCEAGQVRHNTVHRNNTNGIVAFDSIDVAVTDNDVRNNGRDSGASVKRVGAGAAIQIKNPTGGKCEGNTCVDDQVVPTQTAALYLAGTVTGEYVVGDNTRRGGTTRLLHTATTAASKVGVRFDLPVRRLKLTQDVPAPSQALVPAFTIPGLESGGEYRVTIRMKYAASQAADFGVKFDASAAGAAVEWAVIAPTNSNTSAGSIATSQHTVWTLTSTPTLGGSGAAGLVGQDIRGTITADVVMGVNDADLTLSVSQGPLGTPDATIPSVLRAGTVVEYQRVA